MEKVIVVFLLGLAAVYGQSGNSSMPVMPTTIATPVSATTAAPPVMASTTMPHMPNMTASPVMPTTSMPSGMGNMSMNPFENMTFAGNLSCYIGSVVTDALGNVYLDNRTMYTCPGSAKNWTCVTYNANLVEEGHPVFLQTGLCLPKYTLPYLNCARDLANFTTTIASCNVTNCSSFGCNNFMEPSSCAKEPENDIRILPGCTLREVSTQMSTCFLHHVYSYPFQDTQMCRNSVQTMYSCARSVALKCLNSSCHTPLDFIPGLLGYYRIGRHYIAQYDNINELFGLIGNTEIENLIWSYVCPAPGVIPALPTTLAIGKVPIFVCDENFVQDIVDAGLAFARQFYGATSQQQLCMDFTAYVRRVEGMMASRCNLDAINNLITLIPPPYDRLIPVIKKALPILEELARSIQLPNCSTANPGNSTFNCAKYSHSTKACDARKAWICDYLDWRINIAEPFVNTLYAWAEANGFTIAFKHPGCIFNSPDMCKDRSKMRCRADLGGCTFCYCMDLGYSKPASIAAQYKLDNVIYKKLFMQYREIWNNYSNMC